MEPADEVLKQDAAGRVWTPRARREAVLDEFERSGLPATKFAAHLGVKYSTFVSWVRKRRKQRSGDEAPTGAAPAVPRFAGWVETAVERLENPAACALVVHLPGGAHLEIVDVAQATLAGHLLRVLGGGGLSC